MKKNIIFTISLPANDPHLNDYQEWSLKTWDHYCKRHDCKLVTLTEPLMDVELMRPTWQRWHVYDLLESSGIEPNQVMMADLDTMVRWDCPDLFELSQNKYSGVKDDLSIEWIFNSINGYKEYFPGIELEWDSYINNGILILPSDTGRDFCNDVISFYRTNQVSLRDKQHRSLKKGTDQTPVNYLALKRYGQSGLNYLSKKFNLTHIYKTDAFIDDIFIKCSYIWHFNGIPREQRNQFMKFTWEKIKHHYE